MDLITDTLQTQEISFTSILKHTHNLDPAQVRKALHQHHARMLAIAALQYPIGLPPPTSVSAEKGKGTPLSSSKRSFPSDDESSTDDTQEPSPSLRSAPSGRFARRGSRRSGSASKRRAPPSAVTATATPTPKTRKISGLKQSTTPHAHARANAPSTALGDVRARLKSGGAKKLFTLPPAFTTHSSGFKAVNLISETESSCMEDSGHEASEEQEGGDDGGWASDDGLPVRKSRGGAKMPREMRPFADLGLDSAWKGKEKEAGDDYGIEVDMNAEKLRGTRIGSGKIGGTQRGESSRSGSARYTQPDSSPN
ncbi:uncharacterized protein L3040_002977 [Drepanopeziza brunnea f. sp. 'multigermtubi']|uniref:Uncharacterized protein n=1 Tax=Marssonina brunnea f. sp. multigermtubi (strain MB_m1) TaxID=1072389 RepID=K1W7U7_MARBU|nr:uncharacterized protein MBM_08618 [Drepanopeziza brunnea f. sp. 'multigermtubi' MB_m1]EKD13175.1 hypothetical protein MBM_08618 [Drepanopeziza brunnea f. sp. 'multigermtubi' MB_m1]KAJ5047135.1 hypothetical protein L3040_002977 [Drepanopeziza brunnea f. sp. 'multigermtubi']